MTLVGLGYSISMAPASVGPIKAMVPSLDAGELAKRLNELLEQDNVASRGFAPLCLEHGVQV